jgi:hypothetical protein
MTKFFSRAVAAVATPSVALATLLLTLPSSSLGVTIAHWDFETAMIAGSAVSGQNVSHPGPNGAFNAAIPDLSGNGNHLSAFSIDGSGFAVMRFYDEVSSSNRTGSTLSIGGAPGDCCEVLSSDGDLEIGGVKVTNTLTSWTIEASVNFTDAGGWQTIVGKDGFGQATNGDGNQAPLYFQKMGDGTERFRINYVDVLGNVHTAFSTTTAEAGKWYNIAATNDGSTLKFYMNGVEEGSTSLTTSADTRMATLDESQFAGTGTDAPYAWTVARGMYNDGHGDRVNGYIDDVRISSTALTVNDLLNNTIDSLTLVVNTATGLVSIRNDANGPISLDYYKILSPTNGSLVSTNFNGSTGWNSLSDQGTDAIGAAPGESWDEATNALSANQLVEQFLLGDSTLAPGQAISIGAPYSGGPAGDLEFQYGATGGASLTGAKVLYTTATGLPGDFNNDNLVNAADYTVWRDNQGSTSNLAADDSGNGRVDQADYNIWAANYGRSAASTAIPEPTALLIASLGIAGMAGARRRRG